MNLFHMRYWEWILTWLWLAWVMHTGIQAQNFITLRAKSADNIYLRYKFCSQAVTFYLITSCKFEVKYSVILYCLLALVLNQGNKYNQSFNARVIVNVLVYRCRKVHTTPAYFDFHTNVKFFSVHHAVIIIFLVIVQYHNIHNTLSGLVIDSDIERTAKHWRIA